MTTSPSVTRTSRRDRCPATKGLLLLAVLLATPGEVVADQEAGNRPYVAVSEHGQFYAKSVPSGTYGTAGTTRVYQVGSGRDALVQTYAWYSPRIFLAGGTGTGTVYVVRTGPWARGRRAKAEHLALALYRDEKLLKSYSTLDIAGSPEKVAASVSHYVVFSELKGFRRPFGNQLYFDAVTHDGRKLSFDAETGEITSEDEVRVKGQLYEAHVKIGQLKHQWFTRNTARYERDKALLLTEEMLSETAPGEFPKLPAGYRYKPGPVWGAVELVAATGATEQMIRMPGGAYPIGSEQGQEDERPAHQVTLDPFWIDRYEVTNAQFVTFLASGLAGRDVRLLGDAAPGTAGAGVIQGAEAVLLMENTGAPDPRTLVALNDAESRIGVKGGRLATQPGFEQHPVNEVTWNGARAYCAWRGARLPTEAEWEAVARGREGRRYPWGHQPVTAERAVFARASNATEPVGSRPAGATPEGVHDLAGNVAEWTSTLYRPYPYRRDDGREDLEARGERVTRGGDHVFDSAPEKLRAGFRGGFSRATDVGHRHIGFRCAK